MRGLLAGLRERGLDTTSPILAVLDGSKALAAGIREVFDRPVIQRCQLHKLRNVRDHLPQKLRSVVVSRLRAAYHADPALQAQAQLETPARELDKTHPRRRRLAARRTRRDADGAALGRAADPGTETAA